MTDRFCRQAWIGSLTMRRRVQKGGAIPRLAAGQARSRGVYPQAIAQLKEALELLRKLPADHRTLDEELAISTRLGQHTAQ